MRQVRTWVLVMGVVCWSAGAAGRETPPDARLREAQAASDAASVSWGAGRYAEAVEKGEQALALREAVLGGTHPEVAQSLDWLGAHYLLQGNPVRAEPLLQRALAIREAALGKEHPAITPTLNTLAMLYSNEGSYPRAERLHERALELREAALGKAHPLVGESLNNLGRLYLEQNVYACAEPLLWRALGIREAALGKSHPEVAQTLLNLAMLHGVQGLHARAESLHVRALGIQQAALGKSHPLVAESLRWLAATYRSQGLHARVRPLRERAMAILEAALGTPLPDVADTLINLAMLYVSEGEYARAEPLLERALATREASVGKSHLLVAQLLFLLASNHDAQGLYDRAEPLLERALAIWEAAPGQSHPYVTDPLVALGQLYWRQGLYARAAPLLERALALEEAAYGKEHPYVINPLSLLGKTYQAQGAYARAEPLYERALAIQEAAVGKRHPFIIEPLHNLANLYQAQGLYRRAELLHTRALGIREASSDKNSRLVAESLNHLAGLYSAQGLYGQARPLHERALSILEARLGKNHPSIAATLNQLAVSHLAQQRVDNALPLLSRAFAISEQRLRQEALGFTEERLASFLQLLRTDEERLYALLRAHPGDARVRRLALTAALLLKGRSVEESAGISRTIYQSLGEDRGSFERLRRLRTLLAQQSLQGHGPAPSTDASRRFAALSEQSAVLETDLARRSAPLRALAALPAPAAIVDQVTAALPGDAALIEFIAYVERPLVLEAGRSEPQGSGQPRYLALVLLPDATLHVRDLGLAGPINSAASRLRDALANRDAAFEASAQALYQLAFQPLLPLLGGTRRLFLSPDGELALVPFAALHDGHGFLVDTLDFTYVPSGRSLLPRPQEGAAPDSVVVLADPDFPGARPAGPRVPPRATERSVSTLRERLAERTWASTPLPGTRQEAEAIQRLLPRAQLFLGAEATVERLWSLPAPGVLHLATHGFFLEDAPESTGSRAVAQFDSLGEASRAVTPPDPLMRSGLVFAGAPGSASSGALVTALEMAGLNLWGTQLVVLSACDTGRGDVRLGQGVHGLRSAFLVAGAETVVMSLWKVNDETTRELMEAYYRHLLAGQGRATALRQAMRELRRTLPHPHYWAPFIAMGRDTPLHLP